MTIWKETGFLGYRASDDGNIKGPSGKILKPYKNKDGYLSVTIYTLGMKYTRTIHGLVCRAWHGESPPSMFQVRHLDGNPDNNTPDNVKWGDQSENEYDKRVHGRHGGNRGERHGSHKLTNEQVREIRHSYSAGLANQYELADEFGVSQGVISQICSRILWKHLKEESDK